MGKTWTTGCGQEPKEAGGAVGALHCGFLEHRELVCVSPWVPCVAQHLAQNRGSSGICWMSQRRNQKLDWFK